MVRLLLLAAIVVMTVRQPATGRLPASAEGGLQLLVFVASDCPISNYYAPTIQELCAANRAKGLVCTLVYEDVDLEDARMRAHLAEYGYGEMHAVIDRDRSVARRAGATVTPQAVLLDREGHVRYRGRIDNRYEALGKPRRVVTEHDLSDAIEAVLDGRRVRTPETPALGCYIVSQDSRRKRP